MYTSFIFLFIVEIRLQLFYEHLYWIIDGILVGKLYHKTIFIYFKLDVGGLLNNG